MAAPRFGLWTRTRTDTIKQVIRLTDIAAAIGVAPDYLTFPNATGLVYNPREHHLYVAHLDGGFVSIYDTAGSRFLPTLIPLKGLFPATMVGNADVSRIYTLNDRSDNITVIDTATRAVEKVIDLHDYVAVASPGGPIVATQPGDRIVAAGAETLFTSLGLSPRGTLPDPTVRWQVSTNGGTTWADISGATTTSFSLTPTTADDGARYRAVFTNPSGSAASNAATLTVLGGPTPPTFADDPFSKA